MKFFLRIDTPLECHFFGSIFELVEPNYLFKQPN